LLVQRRPGIDRLQQEWNTNIQLQRETNTIIIPARSQVIANEIKETLENLAAGKPNRIASVSITIPIQFNIRRFVYPALQPLLDEVKTQRVYIDSKDRNGLTLRGRSEVINSVKEKINTIINDIKEKMSYNSSMEVLQQCEYLLWLQDLAELVILSESILYSFSKYKRFISLG